MKIHEYNEMMRYLTRPPDKLSKTEKAEVVKDFYKPKSKPMPILDYISTVNRLYGSTGGAVEKAPKKKEDKKWKYQSWADAQHDTDPGYLDPKEMEDIKKSLPVSEMVKQPKKQIIKKTLIVEKPKPVKPPVIEFLELQDWLNEIDPQWWTDEEGKEEVLLRVPKRELKGLASIMNLHKKFVG